jgi:hypothetical protein
MFTSSLHPYLHFFYTGCYDMDSYNSASKIVIFSVLFESYHSSNMN